MPEYISLTQLIPTTPQRLYEAWLSSDEHSKMTGAAVNYEGSQFTAWDDYIVGKTIETKPYERIVQSWRTNEFPDGAEDSELVISLSATDGGTLLTLEQSNLPEGQSEGYADGWRRFYFGPMAEYFGAPLAKFKEATEALESAVEDAVDDAAATVSRVVGKAKKGAQKQAAKAVKSAKKTAQSIEKSVRAALKPSPKAKAAVKAVKKATAKPAKKMKTAAAKATKAVKKAAPKASKMVLKKVSKMAPKKALKKAAPKAKKMAKSVKKKSKR